MVPKEKSPGKLHVQRPTIVGNIVDGERLDLLYKDPTSITQGL